MTGKSRKAKVRWTIETLAAHYEALREADEKLASERDRRYMEVDIAKAKALVIKETADRDALSLARDAQNYKDQQADKMRDKTLAESGVYATNDSVAKVINELRTDLKPLFDFMSGQRGVTRGTELTKRDIYSLVGALVGIVAILAYFTR